MPLTLERQWLTLVLGSCIGVFADQLSKQWVLANFDLHESLNLLPFFNFTYVRNYGAAFSF